MSGAEVQWEGTANRGAPVVPSPGRWSTWLERAGQYRTENEWISAVQEQRIDEGDGE